MQRLKNNNNCLGSPRLVVHPLWSTILMHWENSETFPVFVFRTFAGKFRFILILGHHRHCNADVALALLRQTQSFQSLYDVKMRISE